MEEPIVNLDPTKQVTEYLEGVLFERNRILGVLEGIDPRLAIITLGEHSGTLLHAKYYQDGWNAALQTLRDEVGKVDN